ncbi:MAG: cytochrome c3 family protein [Calditrichota bacterium]
MRFVIPTALAGLFLFLMVAMVGAGVYWDTFEEPEPQPINFPHDLHAGNQQLECTTCHLYVEKSKHAGIPAVQICMNCHENNDAVKGPEIDKLKAYWEKKEPIPWSRVHKVAGHVYFSHKRHIAAGVECETCHGDMTVVKKVKRVRTFQMGFCVSCHRQNNASIDCATCHK